jgi:hypothetical protein
MLRWVLLLRLNIRYLFNEIIVIYSYFIHIYEIYHSDISVHQFWMLNGHPPRLG